MELAEDLRAWQPHLEVFVEAIKAHAPYLSLRKAAVVLLNDARRLVHHIRLYSQTQQEFDEMKARWREIDSGPCFLFECGRCHWQFFADKDKQHWCDQCKHPLKGAARIGKPVKSRKSAQPGVVRHNTPLFERERKTA